MNPLRKDSPIFTKSLWVFGKARWLVGVLLALLGTLGTIFSVEDLNTQLRTDIPGLRCWFPVAMESSKFTIAMSPFVTVWYATICGWRAATGWKRRALRFNRW